MDNLTLKVLDVGKIVSTMITYSLAARMRRGKTYLNDIDPSKTCHGLHRN